MFSVPKIEFQHSSYRIQEPAVGEPPNPVVVNIMRTGDMSEATKVQASTRAGTAVAGVDFVEKSEKVHFKAGTRNIPYTSLLLSLHHDGHSY